MVDSHPLTTRRKIRTQRTLDVDYTPNYSFCNLNKRKNYKRNNMSHHLSLTQVAIADIESIVGNHFKWGNNCELVMEINLVCAPPRPWAKKKIGRASCRERV